MYGATNHDQHCSQNDLMHDATYSLHEIMEIIWLCRQYDSWKYISLDLQWKYNIRQENAYEMSSTE